ncbi:SAM-dependent methyltransferase [Methanobrevibacter sp. OttesenSCG-928-K11]|nr:SAM-dependent methyltransferase [Methanobrevibacter sp. OttesenSCG-928-K11]MDL2270565.1 SAM-dependent methyltransferase [Methanobrevibacter sp. OttesenSCG-928-I08]
MNSNNSLDGKNIVDKKNLKDKISNLNICNNCEDISIKKFSPIKNELDLNKLNASYKRCECGKRPLDIIMSHVLKIMIEEKIAPDDATLRRNTPTLLPALYYSQNNSQFMGEDSILLIHPDFNEKIASRIIKEVPETRGVLKGNVQETVGILQKDSDITQYELLAGSDIRSDIINTLIKKNDKLNKIIINKNQSKINIEVASTTETKLLKLYNYLENNKEFKNNHSKLKVIDGTCGAGATGIFLLMYGFNEIILNDIYSEAIATTLNNLKTNGFDFKKCENKEEIAIGENFKVYNMAFEDLSVKLKSDEYDLCILDCFTGVDCSYLEKEAEKIAKNVLLI